MDIARKVPSISCQFFTTREKCQEEGIFSKQLAAIIMF